MAEKKTNKSKVFPKEEESKLRSKIRSLKSDNKKLIAQVKKLKAEKIEIEDALYNNFDQIKDLVEHIPLEDLLQFSKQKKMGKAQPKVTAKTREETRKKFREMIKGKK